MNAHPLPITCTAAPADEAEDLVIPAAPTVTCNLEDRTIHGVILPYDTLAQRTSKGAVVFAAGAIQHHPDLGRVKLLIDHDARQSVGYCTGLTQTAQHVEASFHIPPGPAGDDALNKITDHTRDGLSVGVDGTMHHLSADRSRTVITAATLKEVSLVSLPAYEDARVLTVKCSLTDPESVNDELTPPAAPATPAAQPQPPAAPAATFAQPPAPYTGDNGTGPAAQLTLSAVTEALADVLADGGGSARDVMAALADIVPANDAGRGFLRDEWVGELWTARRTRRPFVDLFNENKPLRGMKLKGWRWNVRPTVDDYEGNKEEIPTSTASTAPAEATPYRIAGGWDIDRIYVDLGDPDMIEALFAAALEDYLVKSEARVVTQTLAAATAVPAQADVPAALVSLGVAAGNIGANLSGISFAPDVWADFLSTPREQLPWWVTQGSASVSITDTEVKVGGLTLAVNSELAAGVLVAADRRAAKFREHRVRVNAIDLPRGGVDLGLFAYNAYLVQDARAIWSTTVGA